MCVCVCVCVCFSVCVCLCVYVCGGASDNETYFHFGQMAAK